MTRDLEDSFIIKSSRSKPFRKGKKKSFNESIDHQEKRHQKINLKKYLDEIKEEELDYHDYEYIDE